MLRTLSIALVATVLVACSDEGKESSFVSEAVASPAKAPDYGWRTEMAPDAEQEGTVKDYN